MVSRSRPRTRTARLVLDLGIAACLLLASPGRAREPVTFSDQVVRLFQRHCQECHRPGDVGPFSLLDYREAHPQRQEILDAVRARAMPPWKPVPGSGDFLGVRRLSDAEIALIEEWVLAGAPEGDPGRLPPPRAFPDTWRIGQPDLVLTPEAAYEVQASERDVYRCFTVPTDFAEDRYVEAVQVVPGNRKVVHHVLTYLDTGGRSAALDEAEPGPGYTCFGGPGFVAAGGLGGWAPGAPPVAMPDGVGMLLPRGARVVLQVHYHNRDGRVESDRTAIGVRFARKPVDKRVRVIPVLNRSFRIPAGAAHHEVSASFMVPTGRDLHAIAVSPHMHLLGRSMKVTATRPDGAVTPLVHIDDWDFHWQGAYAFARPVPLPGGTRIDVVAVFDNSAANRKNPNRTPRDVTWGEGTTDEMCIAFIRVTADAERLGHVPR